jgi:LAO/AO transport system kinase
MNDSTLKKLIQGILSKERRSIAQALSIIENDSPEAATLLDQIGPLGGKSKIFGITGPPGAGKSTLINSLIESFVSDSLRVAILAIDPSSPFSGGAILGDRARMYSSGMNENIFIRSCASRGQLGGLSPRTPELLYILEAAGFDIIIIETIGVGQAELDIMKCANLVTLVLSPHAGDSLQALKAGIIEIADIFALNKADLPGIDSLEKDLILSLSLAPPGTPTPKLFRITATDHTGVSELKTGMLKQYEDDSNNNLIIEKKKKALEFQFEFSLREELTSNFNARPSLKKKKANLLQAVMERKKSPRKAAAELIAHFFKDTE